MHQMKKDFEAKLELIKQNNQQRVFKEPEQHLVKQEVILDKVLNNPACNVQKEAKEEKFDAQTQVDCFGDVCDEREEFERKKLVELEIAKARQQQEFELVKEKLRLEKENELKLVQAEREKQFELEKEKGR